jgi:HPt (histidine-containing phosphotransfer) domain-containing protein
MEAEGVERDEVLPLFSSFLESSAGLMKEIQEAVDRKDSGRLHRAAHTIKGTFATFGFSALAEHAAALEAAGRSESPGDVAETARLLAFGYREVREAVAEALGGSGEAAATVR